MKFDFAVEELTISVRSVPPLTTTPPVNVCGTNVLLSAAPALLHLKKSVPSPVLVRPVVPPRITEFAAVAELVLIVAVNPLPTEMVGVVPLSVSVREPEPVSR